MLELNLQFQKEIKLRERIRITRQLLEIKGKICRFRQEMLKEDGTVATELELTFGLFDLRTRRLVDPTPEWNKAMGVLD